MRKLERQINKVRSLWSDLGIDQAFFDAWDENGSMIDPHYESVYAHLQELEVALEAAARNCRDMMRGIDDDREERKLRKMDECIRQAQDAELRR